MNKIKIAYIIPVIDIGGAERQLLTLASGLDKNKYDVTVIYFGGDDQLRQDFLNAKVKLKRIESKHKFGIGLIFQLVKYFNQENFDIVHSHLFRADFHGVIAARIAGVPVVSTKHNDERWFMNPFMIPIESTIDRLTAKTVVISDNLKRFFMKWAFIPENRIKRIYYGVDNNDLNNNNNDLKKEFNLDNKKIICNIARLTKQKDHFTLLKALKFALSYDKDIILLIIGKGPLEDKLKSFAKELKIDNNVLFLGFRKDANNFLAISDIFALSSLWEGLGLVFLEAMNQGKPVIATRVSSIPEILKDSGLIITKKNYVELGWAMVNLLKNKDWLNEISNNSKKRFLDFPKEKMIKEHDDLYNIIVNKNV